MRNRAKVESSHQMRVPVPNAPERLDRIKQEADLYGYAELVGDALRAYEWILDRQRKGYEIGSVRDELCKLGFHSIWPTKTTPLNVERKFTSALPGFYLTNCDSCGIQLSFSEDWMARWWPVMPIVWRAPKE